MRIPGFAVIIVALSLGAWEGMSPMSHANETAPVKEIRTYLSVSLPLDPAQVFTLTDLDLSYALGSTLVDWDDSKEILTGLASSWEMQGAKILRLTLSERARWSTGAPITSFEVKQSLDRAKRVHGKDLRSLFDAIESITCPDARTLEIHLQEESSGESLLKKLTEPMYGVVRVTNQGQLDLSVSSGPYFVAHSDAQTVILDKNSFWINQDPGMADRVTLRQQTAGQEPQTILMLDPWPNLVATQSLMKNELTTSLRAHNLTAWPRSLDRALILAPFEGKIRSPEGFQFFRYLQKNLDRAAMTEGLTGFHGATQLFPNGSSLAADDTTCAQEAVNLPESFKGKQLRVLMSPERISPELRNGFAQAIKKIVGVTPVFQEVALKNLLAAVRRADYDFYLGSFGVSDPNVDGTLSYFFELGTPPIPSEQGTQDFSKRTAEIRSEQDVAARLRLARSMLRDVVCAGHFVPLLHFSTVVIARPEIDLSKVPTTDEVINFAKVRFRP